VSEEETSCLPSITTGEWKNEFDEAVCPPLEKPPYDILDTQIVGVFLTTSSLYDGRLDTQNRQANGSRSGPVSRLHHYQI
jgi:hypothetical protein